MEAALEMQTGIGPAGYTKNNPAPDGAISASLRNGLEIGTTSRGKNGDVHAEGNVSSVGLVTVDATYEERAAKARNPREMWIVLLPATPLL